MSLLDLEDTMDFGDEARRAQRSKGQLLDFAVILIHHAEDGEDSHVITAGTLAYDARMAVDTVLLSDCIHGWDAGDFQEAVTVQGLDIVKHAAWWPRYDGTICRTYRCEEDVDLNAGTDYCEACTAYENQEPA
jgi:hypothetical protein